jgi:hypothetical protein
MENIPYAQSMPHSRIVRRFVGAGLKIVTDIAGILGFSLAREEINGDRRGTWSG